MKVKHYQEIADMEGILKRVEENKKNGDEELLDFWAYDGLTLEEIKTQKEVFRYLKNLQHGKVLWDKKEVKKPKQEDAIQTFQRYKKHLEKVHGVSEDDYEEKKKDWNYMIAAKEYECAKHYAFQFSLDGWYERLPHRLELYKPKF